MYSSLQRLNNVSAMATTVIMAVMALVSMTSLVLPTRTDPGSLKVDHVNVLLGRSNYDRQGRAREFAFAKFDIVSDLSPLFNWNTKQVFVYLKADYSTAKYPDNSVVIWDRIIRSRKSARINIVDGKQKYEFKDITDAFRNVSATFSLDYQIQPWVGKLQGGNLAKTEPVRFRDVQRRVNS